MEPAPAEDILAPDRPIIDPHHHLMNHYGMQYGIDDLKADIAEGHNIVATVYVECRGAYREGGPEALKPVGETEFVEQVAATLPDGPTRFCAGIVSHANLLLGDEVDRVLDAHQATAPKRFRGIRHLAAWDDDQAVHLEFINPHPAILDDPAFHRGARRLAARSLSLDTWIYHPQLTALARFARAVPELQIVLDHIGMPVGIGRYAGRAEVFESWRAGIGELAQCPNVALKLGGMVMPITGFGWHERAVAAGSEELAAGTRDYYLPVIDAFGPERCMFESNFPMDREAAAYNVLWNAAKRLAAGFSEDEQDALFRQTAARIYRLEV